MQQPPKNTNPNLNHFAQHSHKHICPTDLATDFNFVDFLCVPTLRGPIISPPKARQWLGLTLRATFGTKFPKPVSKQPAFQKIHQTKGQQEKKNLWNGR